MRKGISLQLVLAAPAGQTADTIRGLVVDTLEGDHEGLHVHVSGAKLGQGRAANKLFANVVIQGERPAPEDYERVTTDLVHRLWQDMLVQIQAQLEAAGLEAAAAPLPQLVQVAEIEDYDTEGNPFEETAGLEAALPTRHCMADPAPVGTPVGTGRKTLPADAPRPPLPDSTFHECPAGGDGGDTQTNCHKNRTDEGAWLPVTLAAILALSTPRPLGHPRTVWPPGAPEKIARFEGLPLQVEGFLAGISLEGPESCNCHSLDDLDCHLWLVDAPGQDRSQSVVIEISPRVREHHPGWTVPRICVLIRGATRVRISGWLMLDPQHPDQIGKTRRTIWEIHPIMQIEVNQNDTWVPLDTATLPGS